MRRIQSVGSSDASKIVRSGRRRQRLRQHRHDAAHLHLRLLSLESGTILIDRGCDERVGDEQDAGDVIREAVMACATHPV